nr:MAG TPA: hypothetical protein [Caudoviricetes sp.]
MFFFLNLLSFGDQNFTTMKKKFFEYVYYNKIIN